MSEEAKFTYFTDSLNIEQLQVPDKDSHESECKVASNIRKHIASLSKPRNSPPTGAHPFLDPKEQSSETRCD